MSHTVPADQTAAELSAWWRLIELCLPLHDTCGALTFRPSGAETIGSDWDEWLVGVYFPVLSPAFEQLLAAACAQDLQAVRAADTDLGKSLAPACARSSLGVGRRVLSDCLPPQGAKLLENLRLWAEQDTTAGHAATVFAVRGQVFHLPGVQLAAAFLLAECVLGAEAAGVTLPAARAAELVRGGLAGSRRDAAVQLMAV
ncbi:MAG: hypothetical protein FGM15_00440 [Chthoniobacterales bacterium]|nr:hypothetical protein [Chthoniobacterales bacterium]